MVINASFLLLFYKKNILVLFHLSNIFIFFLSFLSLLSHSDKDSNSYTPLANFVDILNSQQDTVFGYVQDNVEVSSSQVPLFSSQAT